MSHWANAVITIVHICAVSMDTRAGFAFIYFSFTISTRVTLTIVVVDVVRAVAMDTRHWFTFIYFCLTVDSFVTRVTLTGIVVNVIWTPTMDTRHWITFIYFNFTLDPSVSLKAQTFEDICIFYASSTILTVQWALWKRDTERRANMYLNFKMLWNYPEASNYICPLYIFVKWSLS